MSLGSKVDCQVFTTVAEKAITKHGREWRGGTSSKADQGRVSVHTCSNIFVFEIIFYISI